MATFTFQEYMIRIQADFVSFVAAESAAFRGVGTQSRTSRIRMTKLLLMKGAYGALEAYDYTEANPMWTEADVDIFVGILNDVMGVDYQIGLTDGIWRDDDNAGVWDDAINGGVFSDTN